MRLSHPPAQSYYALCDSWTPRAALQGEVRADVAVLGGGIAGCAAALHLTKRGYKVALLEARAIGFGASGRSGGQTIFGLAVSQQKLVREVGREDARRVFDLSIELQHCCSAQNVPKCWKCLNLGSFCMLTSDEACPVWCNSRDP